MKTTFQRGQKVNYNLVPGVTFILEDISVELEKIGQRSFADVKVSLLPFTPGIDLTKKQANELRIVTEVRNITSKEESLLAATV